MTKLKWFALVGIFAVVMTACFPAKTTAVQCQQGYVPVNNVCTQQPAEKPAAAPTAPAAQATAAPAATQAPAPTAKPADTPRPVDTPMPAPAKPASTPAPAQAGATCVPNATILQWRNSGGGAMSDFMTGLNIHYESLNGSVGRDLTTPPGPWQIRSADLTPKGMVVLITDTAHKPFKSLDGKPLNTTVFKITKDPGSWAGYAIVGEVETPTPGRIARSCEGTTDINQLFPGNTTSANGVY